MEIYIQNSQGQWIGQRFEILPNNTPTLDETLETFSFALISNNIANPIAPMQKVRVYFTVSEYTDFYIVSDSVETYSLKPLRYKHSVSCIQNTRVLSKHVVRNSVFSQPAYLQKSSFNATNGEIESIDQGDPITWGQVYVDSLNWASEKLSLDNHEKVKNPKLVISFQYSINRTNDNQDYVYDDAHTTNDILAKSTLTDTLVFNDTFTLRYKDGNGNTQTETINASTFGVSKLDLNATYEFPRIKALADQGCNDFEVLFNSLDVITGTWVVIDPYSPPPLLHNIRYYQIQIQIVAETYYWSCYDVLDLLIKRQQKFTSIRGDNPLFLLPQSGDLYDLLKNTIAPNFTFTQLTMYECVAEVFRVFDAIFTMDENGVLGIEYFNDLSGDYLTTKQKRFTGRTLALGEDKYTNGLVAHYQDARIVESFPKEEGTFGPVRSVDFGVPEAQDFNFIVPHNIDMVVKCEVLVDKFNIDDGGRAENGDTSLDITKHVVTQEVWSTLDKSPLSGQYFIDRKIKQANTIYYARGDNKIQLAATFKSSWGITKYNLYEAVQMALCRKAGASAGVESTNDFKAKWSKIKLRLTYIASVDGKTKVHSLTNKYDGDTLVDQANGAVDLNKMGLNMLGLSLKLGNPTLNTTHRISTWADRIRVGQLYEYQGALWVANVVNYTFINGYVQGKVTFVQNFNALALRTQLLREKRMSNISKELVQKSEEVITDFCYFSSVDTNNVGLNIHFDSAEFQNFVRDSFKSDGPYSKLNDAFIYDRYEVDLTRKVDAIYIPTVRYGAGNTINLEMAFDHPMNAGNQTKVVSSGTWLGDNVEFFTNHVVYTTNNDDEMIIYLSDNDDKFSAGFIDKVSINFPKTTSQYDSNFPIVNIDANRPLDPTLSGYINIINYEVYKQPNEIFALNYQIAFLPYPGRENTDFLGSEWINNNCFVKDIDENKRQFYVVFKSEKASALDTKVSGTLLANKLVTSLTLNSGQDHFNIDFNFSAISSDLLESAESWAIMDDKNNVLFASNYVQANNNKVTIYFFTRPTRLT